MKRLQRTGILDTAHRVRAVYGRVFRYAIATGRARRDISADLTGALSVKETQSYLAISGPAKVGPLLGVIEDDDSHTLPEGAAVHSLRALLEDLLTIVTTCRTPRPVEGCGTFELTIASTVPCVVPWS